MGRFLDAPPLVGARGARPASWPGCGCSGWCCATSCRGEYRVPWKAIAALAAAALYVVSPFDLIPDFLGPLGFTDDALVLALTWGLLKRELLDYCEWKGLSPGHFGLEAKP